MMLLTELCSELVTTEPAGVSSVSLQCVTDWLLGRKQTLLQPELTASNLARLRSHSPGSSRAPATSFCGAKERKKLSSNKAGKLRESHAAG